MCFFFLVVGLEIKREFCLGELSARKAGVLPICAALGGIVVPALIFVACNVGHPEVKAWGIPMATDIAFSLGVLGMLGSRVPLAVKVFLTALAIVDDVGAVAVIAVFYSKGFDLLFLLGAGLSILGIWAIGRLGVRSPLVFFGLTVVACLAAQLSGIHPTAIAVACALVVPLEPTLQKLEATLHPLSTYLVLPVFALANSGIHFGSVSFSNVSLGIILGLLIGKPVGVILGVTLGRAIGLGELPQNVSMRAIVGIGMLGGIGFTMSLFLAELSLPETDAAKVAIFLASLGSGILGWLYFRFFYQQASTTEPE